MGKVVGAEAPWGRKLTPWAARCSRDLMTGGIGLETFLFMAASYEIS